MNEFEMLMGQGADDAERQRMLAEQLRRRNVGGQVFSLSTIPQIQKMGSGMISNAYDTATQVGNRSQQALTRARQAEQDAQNLRFKNLAESRAAESHMRGQYGAPEWINTPDGMVQMRLNKATGKMEPVSGLPEGATPYEWSYGRGGSGGKTTWKATVGNVDGIYDSVTKQFTPFATGVPEDLAAVEAAQVEAEANRAGEIDKQKELSKGGAEWVNKAVDEGYAAAQGKRGIVPSLNDVIAATEAGARVGKVWNLMPTFTDVTSRYESAVSALTLDNLTNYKLTPVSDKDIAVLRSAAIPEMSNEATKAWAEHKIEAVELLAQADEAVADYINEIGRRPNASDRKRMKEIVDGIVGDFDFTFREGAKPEGKEATSGGNAPPPGTDPEFEAFLQQQGG